ncbi:DUF6491 family protein [uncultured Pseudomonas sp.]|uniref:DUF6491 family protein n=2 Tax=Pseudomonas TaxID=286 RepID=UPI0030DDC358
MGKPNVSILLLASVLLLMACSQQAARNESLSLDEHLATLGYRQGEPVTAVWYIDIDGWQYLDKRHLLLGTGPGRSYLVEFSYPCRNLSFSNLISYSTTVGSLTTLDRIVSIDSSGFPEYCLIGGLYRLEKLPKVSAPAS